MSDAAPQRNVQASALLLWLQKFDLHESDAGDYDAWPATLNDLYNPGKLQKLLHVIEPVLANVDGDNDVTMHLEATYDRLTQFIEDRLREDPPLCADANIEASVKNVDQHPLQQLLELFLTVSVLSPLCKAENVAHIQRLPTWAQAQLKCCIERVQEQLKPPNSPAFYAVPERISMSENGDHVALHAAYIALKAELASTKDDYEKTMRRVNIGSRDASMFDDSFAIEGDATKDSIFKSEISQLLAQISRSEDVIAEAESTNIKQNKLIEGLQKKVETLTPRAEQADAYKDQADENRHLQERLRRLEGSNDKYKKRLEELVVVKRQLQALEEQNISLLDERGILLEDNRKMQSLRAQTEQSSQVIHALEADIKQLKAVNEDLELRIASPRELSPNLPHSTFASRGADAHVDSESADDQQVALGRTSEDDGQTDNNILDDPNLSNAADELSAAKDDFGVGGTTADLKLEIRNLRRQLAAQQTSGVSQILAAAYTEKPHTSDAPLPKSPSPSDSASHISLTGDENMALRAQLVETTRKLCKARAFIRKQDELFRRRFGDATDAESETFIYPDRDPTDSSHVAALEVRLANYKILLESMRAQHCQEFRALISAFQDAGLDKLQKEVLERISHQPSRPPPATWLQVQRDRCKAYAER